MSDTEKKPIQGDNQSVSDSSQDLKQIEVFKRFLPDEVVLEEVKKVIEKESLEEYADLLTKGALLANNADSINSTEFTEEEKQGIEKEEKHPFKSLSYFMILAALTTSFAATNFGMDESAVGGAQLRYNTQFNITDVNIQGIVVGIPYLAAAVIGAPLTVFLDNHIGRRWVIFIASFIGVTGSLWQSFSNNTAALLIGRLYLGIGMGINSASVPVYTAECAPANIRGSVLILWQTFVALGVCLGSVFNLAFYHVAGSLSWRLMIGSSAVPPFFCALLVLYPPESPRWLINHNKVKESLESMLKLRSLPVSGARDFYILYESLKTEDQLVTHHSFVGQFKELFTVQRNRFAVWASFLAVLSLQYGGVNILVSYTVPILTGAGVDPFTAIAGSIGIGGLRFIASALSALFIDRYGRRIMLLITIPAQGVCMFWVGGVMNVSTDAARLGAGLTGMYLYIFFCGLGAASCVWTFVPETPAISVRTAHSAFLMTINWILCFILIMTWPKMSSTMTTSGGLYFYAACNFVIAALIYFYLPETKKYTLEELDEIFKEGAVSYSKRKYRRLGGK